jgi:hypothetical protein
VQGQVVDGGTTRQFFLSHRPSSRPVASGPLTIPSLRRAIQSVDKTVTYGWQGDRSLLSSFFRGRTTPLRRAGGVICNGDEDGDPSSWTWTRTERCTYRTARQDQDQDHDRWLRTDGTGRVDRCRPSGGAQPSYAFALCSCWANKRMVSVVGIDSSLVNGGEEVPVRFKQKKYSSSDSPDGQGRSYV